jgi:hypothetical protein
MIFYSFIIVLCYLLQIIHSQKSDHDLYKCSLCIDSIEEIQLSNELLLSSYAQLVSSCNNLFNQNEICNVLNVNQNKLNITLSKISSREICRYINICPDKINYMSSSSSSPLDIRVSKAVGSKGYDKIRVSLITNSNETEIPHSDIFTYQNEFQYRWTDKYLSSGIVTVIPGQDNILNIEGQEITINIPKQGDGVRGLIFADPCYTSEFIVCSYQNTFDMFNRLTTLLNAINSHSDTSYWQILGDNFYDQEGEISSVFFSALSYETKSKIFLQAPGNHDFWVKATPALWTKKDQQGNGNMQYYGQDVIASTNESPYDFSANPDINPNAENLPVSSNFFTYNLIGNVLMVAFSGAHSFESMIPYFEEACNYATEVSPALIFLLGHWNEDGDGSTIASTTPGVFEELKILPACMKHESKLRYFEGHLHCNQVVDKDLGFMVGANGMGDFSGCGGDWGLPIVDTTEGRFRIYYFPISKFQIREHEQYDNYDAILDCITNKGISQCYELATVWVDTPLP